MSGTQTGILSFAVFAYPERVIRRLPAYTRVLHRKGSIIGEQTKHALVTHFEKY